MAEERITARQRAILMAIVQRYIESGEPVGSGTVAASIGTAQLSPATVRNEMAALADAGLLEQPHTSAGPHSDRAGVPDVRRRPRPGCRPGAAF